MSKKIKKTDFGFKQVDREIKENLVTEIFDKVSKKYDLMNDLSSFGIHRIWKKELINWLAPQPHQSLLDIAGGTGDIAKSFLKNGGGHADILDINLNMIKNGIKKGKNSKIRHIVGNSECLPIKNNAYDRITISFGLRNIVDREKSLNEIYRILKPGGRFICLEFSHVQNEVLKNIYDFWSFTFIPKIGKVVTKNLEAYQYLVESIRMFPNEDELTLMLSEANFSRIRFKNLTGGVVALHSGWKI